MAKSKEKRVMPPDHMSGGVARYMGEAEGYVMVLRPGCTPFCVTLAQWLSWPKENPHAD